MLYKNKYTDFFIGTIASIVGTYLYVSYFSGSQGVGFINWLLSNSRETIYLFLLIISLFLLFMINSRKNFKKTIMYCPSCDHFIKNFELIPGKRIIGCKCQNPFKVIIQNDGAINIKAIDKNEHIIPNQQQTKLISEQS